MFYVSSEIPSSYKYLVEYSDNYVVLARDSYADGSIRLS